MKPISKLVLGSIGGLGVCIGIAQAFKYKVSRQIKSTKLYEEAIDLLREHKGAKYLLGQPIQDLTAKFNTPGESFGAETEVKVNVSGSKSPGILKCRDSPEILKAADITDVKMEHTENADLPMNITWSFLWQGHRMHQFDNIDFRLLRNIQC